MFIVKLSHNNKFDKRDEIKAMKSISILVYSCNWYKMYQAKCTMNGMPVWLCQAVTNIWEKGKS